MWEERRVPLAPCFEGKCQPDPHITTSDIPVGTSGSRVVKSQWTITATQNRLPSMQSWEEYTLVKITDGLIPLSYSVAFLLLAGT